MPKLESPIKTMAWSGNERWRSRTSEAARVGSVRWLLPSVVLTLGDGAGIVRNGKAQDRLLHHRRTMAAQQSHRMPPMVARPGVERTAS